MAKKVLDINTDGFRIMCLQTNDRYNPYRVYRIWGYPGCMHRWQIEKYGDFMSVIYFIRDIYRYAVDTMPINQMLQWCKDYRENKLDLF